MTLSGAWRTIRRCSWAYFALVVVIFATENVWYLWHNLNWTRQYLLHSVYYCVLWHCHPHVPWSVSASVVRYSMTWCMYYFLWYPYEIHQPPNNYFLFVSILATIYDWFIFARQFIRVIWPILTRFNSNYVFLSFIRIYTMVYCSISDMSRSVKGYDSYPKQPWLSVAKIGNGRNEK